MADTGDGHGNPHGPMLEPAGGDVSSAELFAILWRGLADILGTAAAATIPELRQQGILPPEEALR